MILPCILNIDNKSLGYLQLVILILYIAVQPGYGAVLASDDYI